MSDFAFDLTLRDYETARVQHTTDIDIKNWKYLKLEKAVIINRWKNGKEPKNMRKKRFSIHRKKFHAELNSLVIKNCSEVQKINFDVSKCWT